MLAHAAVLSLYSLSPSETDSPAASTSTNKRGLHASHLLKGTSLMLDERVTYYASEARDSIIHEARQQTTTDIQGDRETAGTHDFEGAHGVYNALVMHVALCELMICLDLALLS